MPDYILGVVNYKGRSVPVIDLVYLLCKRKANHYLSTRIVLVKFDDHANEANLIGLLVENITEVKKINEKDFHKNNIAESQTPYIESALADDAGIVHQINTDRILSTEDRQLLSNI